MNKRQSSDRCDCSAKRFSTCGCLVLLETRKVIGWTCSAVSPQPLEARSSYLRSLMTSMRISPASSFPRGHDDPVNRPSSSHLTSYRSLNPDKPIINWQSADQHNKRSIRRVQP